MFEAWASQRSGDLGGGFYRLEAQTRFVNGFGPHTVELYLQAQTAEQAPGVAVERCSLGGFQRRSGFQDGQLTGHHLLLTRLGGYRRLNQAPGVTRGFFVGATLEGGNPWARRGDVRVSGLRTGMRLFLGADTGVGPLYRGLTYAPQGQAGLALFIDRP